MCVCRSLIKITYLLTYLLAFSFLKILDRLSPTIPYKADDRVIGSRGFLRVDALADRALSPRTCYEQPAMGAFLNDIRANRFSSDFHPSKYCDESATPICLLFARYLLKWKIQKKSIFNSSIAYGIQMYILLWLSVSYQLQHSCKVVWVKNIWHTKFLK